uniref:Uncharacterized protein n=1 Tax=Solanum tuberosum TaxID=4113 RepID=M1DA73_SOLTU
MWKLFLWPQTRLQVKPLEIYKGKLATFLLHKKRRNQPKIADLLLLWITSTIGTLLKIDKATNGITRPNSAKGDEVIHGDVATIGNLKQKNMTGVNNSKHAEILLTKDVVLSTTAGKSKQKQNSTGNHANNEDNSEDEEDECDPDYGVEQESNTEEGSDEEFEECDSSDEDTLIDAFSPKTSWKGEKVEDAVSQHRQSLINNGNLSSRSVSRNANVNHKHFAKTCPIIRAMGKAFQIGETSSNI